MSVITTNEVCLGDVIKINQDVYLVLDFYWPTEGNMKIKVLNLKKGQINMLDDKVVCVFVTTAVEMYSTLENIQE